MACGRQFFAAVTGGGGLYTWGLNEGDGRLGHGPRRLEVASNEADIDGADGADSNRSGGGEVAVGVDGEAEVAAGGGGVVASEDGGGVGEAGAGEGGRGGAGGDGGSKGRGLFLQTPVRVVPLSEQCVVQVRGRGV